MKIELDQKTIHVLDHDKKDAVLISVVIRDAMPDKLRDKLVGALATWTKWVNFAEAFR